jgi:hypothetical protein
MLWTISEGGCVRACKCGNQVANNAKSCPKCGHRFTSGLVKVLAWFFGMVVLIAIVGAMFAANSNDVTPSSAPAAPVPASGSTKAKPPSPADLIAARREYANVIDKQLLDMGIESKTYTDGAGATTLVISDALAGRVRENALQKNDALFDQLHQLGFKRLKYTNDFDGDLYFGVEWKIQ